MWLRQSSKALLATVFGTLISVSFPLATLAQTTAGVRIQPTLIEQKVEPGSGATSQFQVTNTGKKEDTFYVSVRDIDEILPGGTPHFATSSAESTGLELSSWIQISKEPLVIAPGETKSIPFSITVPAKASPGAHLGGIIVATQPVAPTNSATAVSYGATAIVSLQVGGAVVDQIRVVEFRTDKAVYSSPDVTFVARIENTGNTLAHPRGPLEIVDMWGKKVGTVVLNQTGAAILPHATREFNVEWKNDGFAFGRYQAVLSVSYGEQSKGTITEYASFWVLPANILVPAIGGILALILIVMGIIQFQVRRRVADIHRVAKARGQAIPRATSVQTKGKSLTRLYQVALLLVGGALLLLILAYFT